MNILKNDIDLKKETKKKKKKRLIIYLYTIL